MQRIALVTGGNQGLGYALVERLCRELGPEGVVYLSARDEARGQAAVQALESLGLHPAFCQLDVTDPTSVTRAADLLNARHGGVDIVISNAAARIVKSAPRAAQVRNFVATNNSGTARVFKHFVPLLKSGARLVVVASAFGSLRHLPRALHGRFDVDNCTLADLEQTLEHYVAAVEAGTDALEGWPEWINIASKVAQVAALKLLARDHASSARARDILLNAACPGLVATEASRPWFEDMSSAQSPVEAALDVVWLATLPPGTRTPYGELVQHRNVIPWS